MQDGEVCLLPVSARPYVLHTWDELIVADWSDWQRKRREEETPAKAEKPKAAERPRERKLKFTFKEQMEFDSIDDDLSRFRWLPAGVAGGGFA